MIRYHWLVYGLDMEKEIEVKMEAQNKEASLKAAIKYLKDNNYKWDTIEEV